MRGMWYTCIKISAADELPANIAEEKLFLFWDSYIAELLTELPIVTRCSLGSCRVV